jgi:hypothetical protein
LTRVKTFKMQNIISRWCAARLRSGVAVFVAGALQLHGKVQDNVNHRDAHGLIGRPAAYAASAPSLFGAGWALGWVSSPGLARILGWFRGLWRPNVPFERGGRHTGASRFGREIESRGATLLISSGGLFYPNFRHAVVLIGQHNEDGALGVVVGTLL